MSKISKFTIRCCLITSMVLVCGGSVRSQIQGTQTSEFQALLNISIEELNLKNNAQKAVGLGTFEQWNINQDIGNLVFSNADGRQAVAPAQVIGTFNTKENTWLWAWDNPSIVDSLKVNALQVKKYGEEKGIEKLTQRIWEGTEEDAWKMTALAAKINGSQGAFRGPSGSTFVYMTFGKVELTH